MKQYVKLLLWGLIPLPVGYLINLLFGWGVMLYPVADLAFMAVWGIAAYELYCREKPIVIQALTLCAVGAAMLVLNWAYIYGPQWTQGLIWWASFYFSPVLLLLSDTAGSFLYQAMGEQYTLPLYCVILALFFGIALLGMVIRKYRH